MDYQLPVKVECYSGYKADEYPVRFFLDSMKFEVNEILDRWYQSESSPDFPPADYFKVTTRDDKIYILKHSQTESQWFLITKGESINMHHHR